jgi:GT2 family glycosyltransferase
VLLDNLDRVPAGGLNRAVATTDSEIVLRVDAHAEVPEDFVERSVAALDTSGADCVGGWVETIGNGPTGRAIAVAMASRLGAGNATYRMGGSMAGEVDTVMFGAYRRSVFQRIGSFDVSLVGAEDDEFNFRLTSSGGRIWFDPAIRSRYFCRDSFAKLARQFRGYGRGKARVFRKHRSLPTLRALAPIALVLATSGSALLSAARRDVRPVLAVTGPYALAVTATGTALGRRHEADGWRVAVALTTMHFSYGIGFVQGIMATAPRRA